MAFTDLGKNKIMDEGIDGAPRFISLHLADDSELSGHGYSRSEISITEWTIASDGVATGPTHHPIYTANDDSAQRGMKIGLYNSVAGSDQLMEPEDISNPPPAPANGQSVQLTVTVNPS